MPREESVDEFKRRVEKLKGFDVTSTNWDEFKNDIQNALSHSVAIKNQLAMLLTESLEKGEDELKKGKNENYPMDNPFVTASELMRSACNTYADLTDWSEEEKQMLMIEREKLYSLVKQFSKLQLDVKALEEQAKSDTFSKMLKFVEDENAKLRNFFGDYPEFRLSVQSKILEMESLLTKMIDSMKEYGIEIQAKPKLELRKREFQPAQTKIMMPTVQPSVLETVPEMFDEEEEIKETEEDEDETKEEFVCNDCKPPVHFETEHGWKVHMTRLHKNKKK